MGDEGPAATTFDCADCAICVDCADCADCAVCVDCTDCVDFVVGELGRWFLVAAAAGGGSDFHVCCCCVLGLNGSLRSAWELVCPMTRAKSQSE